MDKSLLYKKIYGCLAAGAIGDALGAPFEGMHHKDIGKLKGWPENVPKEVNAAGLMVVFGYFNRDYT